MKHSILYIVAFFLLFFSCSHDNEAPEAAPEAAVDTVPAMVVQIRKHSRLYTAEYNVHKIVTHDDVMRLKGNLLGRPFDVKMPVGDRKIAIPMDARLKAYIDFSGFSEENIERSGDRITIVLPDPKVVLTATRIDRQNVREYVSLTRSRFTDAEMSSYESQGRAAIIAAIPEMGIIETARENAARVLVPMISQMGYDEKNITVTFRKEFGAADIRTLLDRTTIEKR
ncbi:MAG: DUF4230 domain-containing protein [Prevotella sp.]|nr:DUF4230 domain-containing protein [Prevotella sp.]